MIVELKERGMRAINKAPIKVSYKDTIVGEYFANILVKDKVIIELKAVVNLSKLHKAQILNYLKATGIQGGVLANMVLGLKE